MHEYGTGCSMHAQRGSCRDRKCLPPNAKNIHADSCNAASSFHHYTTGQEAVPSTKLTHMGLSLSFHGSFLRFKLPLEPPPFSWPKTSQKDIPDSIPPRVCLSDMPCKLPAVFPRI